MNPALSAGFALVMWELGESFDTALDLAIAPLDPSVVAYVYAKTDFEFNMYVAD